MPAKNLATVFGPNILRDDTDDPFRQLAVLKFPCLLFLKYFSTCFF
jgi:hypothetical protein